MSQNRPTRDQAVQGVVNKLISDANAIKNQTSGELHTSMPATRKQAPKQDNHSYDEKNNGLGDLLRGGPSLFNTERPDDKKLSASTKKYPITIIDIINRKIIAFSKEFIDERRPHSRTEDIILNNIDLRKSGNLKKITNPDDEYTLWEIDMAGYLMACRTLGKRPLRDLGKQITDKLLDFAAEYELPEIATATGVMQYAKSTFQKNDRIVKRLTEIEKQYEGKPFVDVFSDFLNDRVKIKPKDIESLSQSSLGQEISIVAQELAKELQLPEIATVKNILAYARSIFVSNNHYLVTTRLMPVIQDCLPKPGPNAGRYSIPLNYKTAVYHTYDLLLGRGDVTPEDLAILNQKDSENQKGLELLGIANARLSIAEIAEELAEKLKMPKIATINGLIAYVQQIQGFQKPSLLSPPETLIKTRRPKF